MVFEKILGNLLRVNHKMNAKNHIIKITQLLILFLAGMLATSCIPTRNLIVDIPRPSSKELPQSVQSLTIVSQIVDDKFTDLEQDSLQKIFYKSRFNLDTVIYDFQMADTTLKALGVLLFESGRYDYVIPEARFLDSPKTSNVANVMPWYRVRELCNTFNTDAVLSLDYLRTRVKTHFSNESFFDPFQGGFNTAATASIQINYEALFRIYDPAKDKILLQELIIDTLYWDDINATTRALFSHFTPVKKALAETGIVIALDLSDKIGVRWQPERRKYFVTGNSRFKKANRLAEQGNWLDAVQKWEEVAENTSSKTMLSKVQLNIALGYEILGDIDNAIAWALKSYETMFRPLTYEYLETLKKRKNELKNTK